MASSPARSAWCSSRKARDAVQVSVLIQASITSPHEQRAVGDVDRAAVPYRAGRALLDRRIIRASSQFVEDGLYSIAQEHSSMFTQIVTARLPVGHVDPRQHMLNDLGSISNHAGSSPARPCHVMSKSEGSRCRSSRQALRTSTVLLVGRSLRLRLL